MNHPAASPRRGGMRHNSARRISRMAHMIVEAQELVLTRPEAACLVALRRGKTSQPEIAIATRLDLRKAAMALRELGRHGLAIQKQTKEWQATERGTTERFKIVPGRAHGNDGRIGPGGRRLLELLDRPMRHKEIVEKLGLSRQRVHQLLIKLHAQGRITFGDPENPCWIVMPAGDKTSLLARAEERVLSAVPQGYATNAIKIRVAARVPESKVQPILNRLILRGLVEAMEGLQGDLEYQITAAGLAHPQNIRSGRPAEAPRLPVESDRIRTVLSAIADAGALRIKDVADVLCLPGQSINALMQYLKRKDLVEKIDQGYLAPYSLTEKGHAALAEMTRRRAA
jgi:Mn-dependent DtxR family transcriptional regulator